ncbi:MAG: hypothetical protein KGH77_03170 [Candidatus Micrarchaeota archaeon]|nr:hypothetical protein [Candidatus Micrarchaeota archaeon]MDE1864402.1 hypothetical protein [Candidatus Micrarchaeota archaeon]
MEAFLFVIGVIIVIIGILLNSGYNFTSSLLHYPASTILWVGWGIILVGFIVALIGVVRGDKSESATKDPPNQESKPDSGALQ